MFGSVLICDEEFIELNRVTEHLSDYYFKS